MLDISKRVEKFLVKILHVLKLLWEEVLEVLVHPSLARSVRLIPRCRPLHHLVYPVLDDGALERFKAKHKAKDVLELLAWVLNCVLESEEVNRYICVLSDINPILEPGIVTFANILLESEPVGLDGVPSQLVVKS